MEFEFNYDDVMAVIKEEIAREASQAYTSEGVSLYDALRWVSRDQERSRRIMAEVLSSIKEQCNRFICCAEQTSSGSVEEYDTLAFSLKDSVRRTEGRMMSVQTLLRSMVTNMFLNKYFLGKNNTDLASKYDALAVADIKSLTSLLYTKMPPTYPV